MGESMENKDWHYSCPVHKMIPSFSIMGSEYEDMAKKIQSYSGDLEDQREEIDSLVLQLSTICNQACEELQIEYNNIKKKTNGK
jgi:NTP pyrophosphatase (non-canonical NTP hydrolase)